MIATSKAILTAVIVAVTAAAVLIAGCSSITSSSPVALAGANQTAKVGTVVTLDGSRSSAPGGGALTYDWSFSAVPRESAVSFANYTSDRPSFTPDKAGTYVVSLVVKDSAGKASAPDETHVTVVPAGRSDTKIIVTSASKKDLWLGDQVTTTGRLVDAEGNGIPNQTINFKSVARVLGLTVDNRLESVTTDSTGAFTKETLISAQGAPSLINTVQVEGWIEYAGNDFYKPTSTSHVQVTVHLTSAPAS
jgi:hypothetical protein